MWQVLFGFQNSWSLYKLELTLSVYPPFKHRILPMAATLSSFSDDLHSPIMSPPSKKAGTEKICIDEMLEKYCGEFGKWQLKHFILTCLAWALEAFHTMVMIFADREPDWKCVSGTECAAGGSVCEMAAGSWEWIGGKDASTVTEWSLICGDKFKVGLVQAVFFTGCMIGSFTLFSSLLQFDHI